MNVVKKFIATIDHKKLFVSAGVKLGVLKTNHQLFYSLSVLPNRRAISSSSESSGSDLGASALSLTVGITGRWAEGIDPADGGGGGGGGGALGVSGKGGGALLGGAGAKIGGDGRGGSGAVAGALTPSSVSFFGVMIRCVLDKNDGIPGGRGGGAGLAGGVLRLREGRGALGLKGGGGAAKGDEDDGALTIGAVVLLESAGLFWAKRSGGRLSGPAGFKPVADGLTSASSSSSADEGAAGQLAEAVVGALRVAVRSKRLIAPSTTTSFGPPMSRRCSVLSRRTMTSWRSLSRSKTSTTSNRLGRLRGPGARMRFPKTKRKI
jgi:hypothetical protein